MQQFAILSLLAIILPAVTATASDRAWFVEHGWGRYGDRGGDRFEGDRFDTPNTFATVTGTAFPGPSPNPGPNNPSNPSSSTSSSSGFTDGSLIPSFGITPGVSLNDGTPRCAGDGGRAIECDCPPNLDTFSRAVDVARSSGAPFPEGES